MAISDDRSGTDEEPARLLHTHGSAIQREFVALGNELWSLAALPVHLGIPHGSRDRIERFLDVAERVVTELGGNGPGAFDDPFSIPRLVKPGASPAETQVFHVVTARFFEAAWLHCRCLYPVLDSFATFRAYQALIGIAIREFSSAREIDRAWSLLQLFVDMVPAAGLRLEALIAVAKSFAAVEEAVDPHFLQTLFPSHHVLVITDFCEGALEVGRVDRVHAILPQLDWVDHVDAAQLRELQGWRYTRMQAQLALAIGNGETALQWAELGLTMAVDEVSHESAIGVMASVRTALYLGHELPDMSAFPQLGDIEAILGEQMKRIDAGGVPLEGNVLESMLSAMGHIMAEDRNAAHSAALRFIVAYFGYRPGESSPSETATLRELGRQVGRELEVELAIAVGEQPAGAVADRHAELLRRTLSEAARDSRILEYGGIRLVAKVLNRLELEPVLALWPLLLGWLERELDDIERAWCRGTPEDVAAATSSTIPALEESLALLAAFHEHVPTSLQARHDILVRRHFDTMCSPALRREADWKQLSDGRPAWLAELGRELSLALAGGDDDGFEAARRRLRQRTFGLRRDAGRHSPASTHRQRLPRLLLATCGPFENVPESFTIAYWDRVDHLGEPIASPVMTDLTTTVSNALAELNPASHVRGRLREFEVDPPGDAQIMDWETILEFQTGREREESLARWRGHLGLSLHFVSVFEQPAPELFLVQAIGTAQRVPFAAVVVDDQWLGASALAVMCSGIGDPDQQLRVFERSPSALVVASPEYRGRLSDLPGTAAEAEHVRAQLGRANTRQLVGEAATREAVLAALERDPPDVLHFAVHGVADQDRPERSFLALAGDADRPLTILSFDEITTLALPRTRLVVLSACSTMLGQSRRSEGIVALSWAFKSAGVDMVVAARWPVVDAAVPDYWREFYASLASEHDVARAMLRAQRAMMVKPGRKDPSIWAVYQLVV